MINNLRDLTRNYLYKFSSIFGEALEDKPASLALQKVAQQSMHVEVSLLSCILPYESFDENNFFINKQSVGFGFTFQPLGGADESLLRSLAELIKNKLPKDCDCTFMLYKHHFLEQDLARGFSAINNNSSVYQDLANISLNFHKQALSHGYPNTRNSTLQLCDYQCFLFVSIPRSLDYAAELTNIRDDFLSELTVAGLKLTTLDQQLFKKFLRTLLSPNLDEIKWPELNSTAPIANPSSVYKITDDSIDHSIEDAEGILHETKIINCGITEFSRSLFGLWQTPDFFANILKVDQGIRCPFLISFTIRGVNQELMKTKAKRRAKSLSLNANAIQCFLNPSIIDEATEWQTTHKEVARGQWHLLPVFYNIVLFSTKDKEREHLAQAISAYRQLGFTLTRSRLTQWLRFLASLPFMASEGLFNGLETLGLTHTINHFNAANLLPVIADFKGAASGLLLPTYRHQLFYYDPFDDKNLPITNYNRLTVASSGSGKSYLQSALILDGLSRGHQIFVIDLGSSYKYLCQHVGGTYLDVTTLTLNPFTLFNFDGLTEIDGEKVNDYVQIRDLLAIMASPKLPLEEVQRAWLLEVTLACWQKYGALSSMDDVLTELNVLLNSPHGKHDRRLKDLIVLLSKYGKDGVYGAMFNGATPLLNNSSLTVLEMGGLAANPELLSIVMFVMIVIIQGQFYQGDRKRKKQCIIDEAWRFLGANANPTSAQFIEQGFRTARKYLGGFAVITQQLEDTQSSLCGQAIKSSSDTTIIMRQGNFQEYVNRNPNIFTALQKEVISGFGEAKMQGYSSLMLQFGNVTTFHRYFSDPYLRILFSTSGEEFSAVAELVNSGLSLSEAVAKVAKAIYGETPCID